MVAGDVGQQAGDWLTFIQNGACKSFRFRQANRLLKRRDGLLQLSGVPIGNRD